MQSLRSIVNCQRLGWLSQSSQHYNRWIGYGMESKHQTEVSALAIARREGMAL